MSKTDDIPSLEGLDPAQEDYAKRLDQGLRKLSDLSDEVGRQLNQRAQEFNDGLVKLLGEEGIELKKGKTIQVSSPLGNLQGNYYNTHIDNPKQIFKIQEIMVQYKKEQDRITRPLVERRDQLNKAFSEFGKAVIDNTKIEPLNKNAIFTNLHLYIITPHKVYEIQEDLPCHGQTGIVLNCQYGKKPLTSRPITNSKLDPKLFEDPNFIEQFRAQSQGAQANAYLIINPSTEIPVETLTHYAFKEAQKQACGECPVGKNIKSMKDFGSGIN